MDKTIKIFKGEVKSIDLEKKRAVVVVSTDKKDGDGDIVLPEAFKKRLKRYNDHPVLLSSHSYYRLMDQIGVCHKLKINDNNVEADFEWFSGNVGSDGKSMNPEADWAWLLAQKGIAAFSIGFQGLAYDYIEEKDAQGNKRITGRKFTEIELLEISQVIVPSNAGALQQSIDDTSTTVEVKEMAELVLKGMKDGKIIYQENVDAKNKKDNTTDNAMEARMIAIEKSCEEIKACHADHASRIKVLEDSNTEVEEETEEVPMKSKHYSKDLLAPEGIVPILDAQVKSELDAISEAFRI